MKTVLRRIRQAAAILPLFQVLVLLVSPSPSTAGTIGFRTETELRSDQGLDAKVTLTHTGDEAAIELRVRAEFEGAAVDGEQVASLPPAGSHVWNLRLSDAPPRGVHPVVLRVRYSDSNGAPFEIVSVATTSVLVEAAPPFTGKLDIPRVTASGRQTGNVTVKRPPGRSGNATVRYVAPAGLTVEPESIRLQFDESGKATAEVRVRNERLLAGTTVNLFALVTADDAGFPQTDAIRGNVVISTSTTRAANPRFYEAAAAMALLLVVLEVQSRLRGRKNEGSAV